MLPVISVIKATEFRIEFTLKSLGFFYSDEGIIK